MASEIWPSLCCFYLKHSVRLFWCCRLWRNTANQWQHIYYSKVSWEIPTKYRVYMGH